MNKYKSIDRYLKYSVIRRSAIFACIVFFGFLLNYLVQYLSSRLLDLENFGIFYESIVIVNLFTVPVIVLGMYFSRYVVNIQNKSDITLELIHYIFMVRSKGASILFFLVFLLLTVWFAERFDTLFLALIILLVVYSNYLIEALKTVFEASNRVILTGIFTTTTLFFRFLFGVLFLFMGGTVWSGMLGIMISGYLSFFLFNYYYIDRTVKILSNQSQFKVSFKSMTKFLLSFFLVSLIMYLDVVVAYFILPLSDLGVYAASSTLPKGLLLFTQPLTKVLYPIIADKKNEHSANHLKNIFKMLGVMLFVSALGTLILVTFKEFFVDGILSINHVSSEIFLLIVFSIIPLVLLRTMVAISLARGDEKSPLLLIFPVILYIVYVALGGFNLLQFTNNFLLFSWGALIFYATIQILLYFLDIKVSKL